MFVILLVVIKIRWNELGTMAGEEKAGHWMKNALRHKNL